MTSDINGTVVAIQGNAVQSGTLGSNNDGYVLTWKNSNNEWEAKPSVGLQSQTFTSNGTWTCPAGITTVCLTGYGGGGSGSGGGPATDASGSGGGASVLLTQYVTVVPGTSYTVTIGVGGTGVSAANNGNAGVATTFGSLATFNGGGFGRYNGGVCYGGGRTPFAINPSSSLNGFNYLVTGTGGNGYQSPATNGFNRHGGESETGYIYSNPGTDNTCAGGGGGGSGPGGVGTDGGDGGSGAGMGGNSSNAGANTGAGSGGGGAGAGGGGSSGSGGSGQLTVVWVG